MHRARHAAFFVGLWASFTAAACGGSGDVPLDGDDTHGTSGAGASGTGGGGTATGSGGSGTSGGGGSTGQGGQGTGASGGGQQGGGGTGGAAGAGGSAGAGGAAGGGGGGGGPCVDGETVECYSGDPATLGIGACVAGKQTCDGGAFGPCEGEVTPSNEICNGEDDDCNGTTDELGTETCGKGACAVTVDVCDGGKPVKCEPLPPSPVEACDGTDDDCDGDIDEGCSCIDGQKQACYGGPQGTADVGECKKGEQTCAGGAWGPCEGEVLPTDEDCDGKDDDCDGNADEDLGTTVCGQGACQVTSPNCEGGQPKQCEPGQPGEEACNGTDDDCNGLVDDGLAPLSCGIGECETSVPACLDGKPNPCVPEPSTPETCDGKDNDCEGNIDDGNPGGGMACSTGQFGVCAEGTTACSNGGIVCNQNVQAGAETCNGLDDDCDSLVDDGDPGGGAPCNTGLSGVCAEGTTKCSGGMLVCVQKNQAGAETCNGLDDDCDGAADEGDPGGGQACATGVPGTCGVGQSQCKNGAIVCNQTVFPSPETCDGQDNDCDFDIDEGNPGGGASCSTGLPGACGTGVKTCDNAAIICKQTAFPIDEVCGNAKDDDCDGATDEDTDADGDGWGTCSGDCCDKVGLCSATPNLVNPGAYEVVGNSVDDDCDPNTKDNVAPADCSPPALQTPTTATKLVQAMELCQFTTANPPLAQKKWGVISPVLTSANGAAAAPKDIQVGVLANYGTNVKPKKGATMAALSSGTARDQGDPGWIQPNGTGWNGGTTSFPPPAYLAAHGGKLQTKPGCTTANDANDSANLKVQIRVPTNAKSFSYRFKFYSAEYPEWVCTLYNDFFLALLTSQVAGIPADKNISFDKNKNPVSVNNGFFEVCQGCPDGTAELIGTGMGGNNGALNDGGGTSWLQTTSPIKPGETMTIELIIWDTGDHYWDSLVLLDDFQWSLNPAVVGTEEK